MLEVIKIGEAEIILQDYEFGKGKIIIAAPDCNFSYQWGAMNNNIRGFLLSSNTDYIVRALSNSNDRGVFDAKATLKAVRHYIRKEMFHELPWYKWREAQKELRSEFKRIESDCEDEREFVDRMQRIKDICFDIDDHREERDFKETIGAFCDEPWNFICKGDSYETNYLKKLFPLLQKELKR
jgi:hypothetical protein